MREVVNRLNYPGDVRDSFQVDTLARNIRGETMTDVWGYPLLVRGIEFDGENTTLLVEVLERPSRGEK